METTAFLIVFAPTLFLVNGNTPQTREAVNYLAQATYKLHPEIEQFTNDMKDKYVPKIIDQHSWALAATYRLVKDNKIEYGWTF